MKVFNNTNRFKKLILIVVFMMLFSFCCPKQVHAVLEWEDVVAAPCKIIYMIESGILEFLDNIFCDKERQKEKDIIHVSPESIIKGKFALLDPDIFKKIEAGDPNYYDSGIMVNSEKGENDTDEEEFGTSIIEGKIKLRDTISGWYYALRNLAIIALLSVLVYVGIRMTLTSISQDKAKYKTMLKDWFIALCLLFSIHYIMLGILHVSSMVTNAIGNSGLNINFTQKSMTILGHVTQEKGENRDDGTDYTWVDELGEVGEVNELYDIADGYAQCVMLGGIIGYTLIFAVKYLKRMITIVFLILLAPISCITYPIDKIGDGKAQAYNRWFQEFLYNVIIQPFHLLIYVVLVGSATTLANINVLYGIMCFAVMIPAEKLIKEMFGFKDKLGSPLGAFAGGALTSQLMNAMKGGGKSGNNNNKIEGKSEADNGFRENKLKPGLPGASEGSGEPVTYDNENGEDSSINTSSEENEDNGAGAESDAGPMIDDDGMGTADMEAYANAGQNQVGESNSLNTGEENNTESNSEDEGNNDETESQEEEANSKGIYKNNPSKVENAFNAMREHRDKKLIAKYGTKNRGKAFGKYVGRKAVSTGKRTIKGAATLAGAGALAAFGTMFGQGKAGLAAGAALGAKTGDGINNSISKTASTVGEYGKEAIYAAKTEEQRRKDRIKKAMQDPNQVEKASRSFAKRNNGKIANTEELNKELADRARFKETGLNDDQIDDAMQIYDKSIEELGEDGALKMAVASAETASRYSAKDFEDPKKTQQMYDSLMRTYANAGVNQDLADENARAIISNAASTYGIKNPAFSTPSRKDAYKADAENIERAKASYRSRHNNQGPNKQQLDQELEMGFNLRKAGISEENREQFFNEYLSNAEAINEARASLGADATESEVNNELERRFEIKIKANIDSERELTGQINAAKDFIKSTEDIQKPSNGKVYSEIKQRLTVKDSYHINEGSISEINSKITQVRKSEAKFVKDSADKEGAKKVIDLQRSETKKAAEDAERNGRRFESHKFMTKADYQRKFLTEYSAREMNDEKTMDTARKKIRKSLEKQYSPETARQFANEIVSKGLEMCGIEQ